ncbi:MAG: lipoate--protein ligase [Ruminococcaceae bacterium]|nr:lipoate--protein ligase [Oscillospiraceae bacterium]
MKNTVYIEVTTTDPTFNLALEEYVFEQMPRENQYFITWQNDNAIIVGRHQNTETEINEEFVREKNIKVVRRLSGGGAVYHDLGNLNFTFIADAEPGQKVDLHKFCQPIADTLRALGANASVNGRNDILVDDKKVSGNAQYVRQGRVMHHGTILFDSDMSVLSQALLPHPEKMKGKGVKSVRSRVTNVRPSLSQDMTMEEFRRALASSLMKNGFEYYELTPQDIAAIEDIRLRRYATREWNYGFCKTTGLTRVQRIEGCGTVEAHISFNEDFISQVVFHGDFFSTRSPEELGQLLIGLPLNHDAIRTALEGHHAGDYITGLTNEDVVNLLCNLQS